VLSEGERVELLRIARRALEEGIAPVGRAAVRAEPPPDAESWPGLSRASGVFVTLRKLGDLRGCIGRTTGSEPLWRGVRSMAVAAATQDPRFPAVERPELSDLHIEISVLGELSPCAPSEVQVGRDGLVVEGMGRRGLLLPEVAVEQGWDAAAFVRATCRKAGLPPDATDHGARLSRFQTEHFGEPEGSER
jgi:AmmeMemoRadiSam system protein A